MLVFMYLRKHTHKGAHGLPEEAAIPPQSKEAKKKAKKNNKYQFEYGGGKLDCELCLAECLAEGAYGGGGRGGYTILRLPDVVGPWDNIGSQLRLQEALIAGISLSLLLPRSLSIRSLCFCSKKHPLSRTHTHNLSLSHTHTCTRTCTHTTYAPTLTPTPTHTHTHNDTSMQTPLTISCRQQQKKQSPQKYYFEAKSYFAFLRRTAFFHPPLFGLFFCFCTPVAGKTIGTKVGAPCGRVSLVGAADVARAVAAVLRSALLSSTEP
jgi:hypothetical protein